MTMLPVQTITIRSTGRTNCSRFVEQGTKITGGLPQQGRSGASTSRGERRPTSFSSPTRRVTSLVHCQCSSRRLADLPVPEELSGLLRVSQTRTPACFCWPVTMAGSPGEAAFMGAVLLCMFLCLFFGVRTPETVVSQEWNHSPENS